MEESLKQDLAEYTELLNNITDNFYVKFLIESSQKEIDNCLRNKGKILIAGNGGSAAEAQHFSAELIGRFVKERRALPAIALTTDTSNITAIGNDYGYDRVFERQIYGLGNAGDVLVVLSTSGNSPNLLKACVAAKERNMKIIGLLGKDGGKLKDLCDFPIIIPSQSSARIQEMHLFIIHTWCRFIDKMYD
jgi:D-sedoheptulose 7-phosphate isomerase